MPVVIGRGGTVLAILHGCFGITELSRAGNKRDSRQLFFLIANAAHHFKSQLRQAVSKVCKRQFFKHHIGKAAIGWHIRAALFGSNQRICFLFLITLVNAHGDFGCVYFLAIRPHPQNVRDWPLTDPNRKVGIVAVGCLRHRRRRTTARLAAMFFRCGGHNLMQICCPDHLPGNTRTPGDKRNHCPFTGPHHLQVIQPLPFHMALAARSEGRNQHVV
ncbi:hypothetical protein PsWM33_04488 [Pseudovibrio sp. WM33]|nr:hypothetical protein PsWM33_04488 [Pseudovibrio sp. WM33]